MRQPSKLLGAVLVAAQVLTAGGALSDLYGPQVAGFMVLIVASLQAGLVAYQKPPDLPAARAAVRAVLRDPLVLNGDPRRTRLDADVRAWDAVHTALDAAGVVAAPPVPGPSVR